MKFLPQLAVLGTLGSICSAGAQAQVSQAEWWPEIDAYVKLDQRITLMNEVSRTRDGESYNSADIGPTLYFSLKPILRRKLDLNNPEKGKYLTFGIGYRYIPTLNKPAEDRLELELNPRFVLPGKMLLSNRFRVDIRDIGGHWSWRYRQRVTLERNFKAGRIYIAPYAQGELFYDDRYAIWNRNVYEFGFTLGLRRWLDLKPYYAHQNDSRFSIPHVNAAGLTAPFYLQSK